MTENVSARLRLEIAEWQKGRQAVSQTTVQLSRPGKGDREQKIHIWTFEKTDAPGYEHLVILEESRKLLGWRVYDAPFDKVLEYAENKLRNISGS